MIIFIILKRCAWWCVGVCVVAAWRAVSFSSVLCMMMCWCMCLCSMEGGELFQCGVQDDVLVFVSVQHGGWRAVPVWCAWWCVGVCVCAAWRAASCSSVSRTGLMAPLPNARQRRWCETSPRPCTISISLMLRTGTSSQRISYIPPKARKFKSSLVIVIKAKIIIKLRCLCTIFTSRETLEIFARLLSIWYISLELLQVASGF